LQVFGDPELQVVWPSCEPERRDEVTGRDLALYENAGRQGESKAAGSRLYY
jgi:hypothetical protein